MVSTTGKKRARRLEASNDIKQAESAPDHNEEAQEPTAQQSDRPAGVSGRGRSGVPRSSTAAGEARTNGKAAEGGELDELFGKLKAAKATTKSQPPQVTASVMTAGKGKKKKRVAGSKDDIFGEGPAKASRKSADGLAVYTEDELKVGKGGNTDLCPFDCECCF